MTTSVTKMKNVCDIIYVSRVKGISQCLLILIIGFFKVFNYTLS